MDSIWTKDSLRVAFPKLPGSIKTDMLIIGGTSLVVYPAAGLVNYYRGNKLVLINKSKTSMDSQADLAINEPIGQVFSQIIVR